MSENKVILIVDDSPTVRDMRSLDGREGVGMLKNLAPDVIITDINMPRLDGFQFIEKVRKDPRHRGTPILVLTTESSPEMKNRAHKAGATGWIVKPFDPEKLMEVIHRIGA